MTIDINDDSAFGPGENSAQEAEETVEQPISEQPEETTEEPGISEESGEDSAADKPKKGVQKRIDELTAKKGDAERERDYWREKAMRSEQQSKPPEPPKTPEPTEQPKPKQEDFGSYEDFTEAVADWKAEQKLAAFKAELQQEHQQTQKQEQQREKQETFQQRAQSFRAEMPDFDDVAFNQSLPVSEAMSKAILESEEGPKLLYHLGKNPEEAARIAGLSPYAAALEIGKIAARLNTPPPKKPTKAPDPIKPLGASETHAIDPEKMSMDEWVKFERERMEKKFGGVIV